MITPSPRLLPALAFASAGICLVVAILIAVNSGADPEDVNELAQQYTDSENNLTVSLTETQAQCRATVYLESDLSDGALDDVRAGRPPRPRNKEDVQALAEVADDLTRCL